MIILTEEKFNKLKEIEGFKDSEVEIFKATWQDDPIYVWGGRDEDEAYDLLRKQGYKWEDGKELEKFSPGWTWGYPAIIFRQKGNILSYSPLDFGRETDEEPNLD